MIDLDPKFSIGVKRKELVVTLPGTSYAVTYFKRDGSPGLLAKDIVNKDDPRLPIPPLSSSPKLGSSPTRSARAWLNCLGRALPLCLHEKSHILERPE
jgi:hypothetical protein